jgi:hypothetical protein
MFKDVFSRPLTRANQWDKASLSNREFESHPLRHLGFEFQLAIADLQKQEVPYEKRA